MLSVLLYQQKDSQLLNIQIKFQKVMPSYSKTDRSSNNQIGKVQNLAAFTKKTSELIGDDSSRNIHKSTIISSNYSRLDQYKENMPNLKINRKISTNSADQAYRGNIKDINQEKHKIHKENFYKIFGKDNAVQALKFGTNKQDQDQLSCYSARTNVKCKTFRPSIFGNVANQQQRIDDHKNQLRQTVANYKCWHFKTIMDQVGTKTQDDLTKTEQEYSGISKDQKYQPSGPTHCNSVDNVKVQTPSKSQYLRSSKIGYMSQKSAQGTKIIDINNTRESQNITDKSITKQTPSTFIVTKNQQDNVIDKITDYSSETKCNSAMRVKYKKLSFFGRKKSQEQAQSQITIEDFKLGECKGEGRFGKFYPAIHKKTGMLLGIKQIKKQSVRLMLDQFVQQVKISFFLEHPYLVKLYGSFHDNQNIYLIMEYMQQGTLYRLIKSNKKLPEEESAEKLRQICKAVLHMHQNHILHRDIKPQNIVLTNGVSKLCDFGWAAYSRDRRKTYCGTLDYVCPQILEGQSYDHLVDIWAIGVLAYEMLVGKAPFYHISRQQTMKNIMKCDFSFPAELSSKAKLFITKALQKNPDRRFSVESLLQDEFLQVSEQSG